MLTSNIDENGQRSIFAIEGIKDVSRFQVEQLEAGIHPQTHATCYQFNWPLLRHCHIMGDVDTDRFEWDRHKEAANEAKHGISFLDAANDFFDPLYFKEDSSRPEHGEVRLKAIGTVGDQMIAVIFTYRLHRRRIISAWRARPDERQRYDQGRKAR